MSTLDVIFLGTCACNYSRYTERLQTELFDRFDKDARRASSVLLGGHMLIDCGPHCLDALRIVGMPTSSITDLFLTHLHSDHFNPDNVQAIANAKDTPLRVWVSEGAVLPDFSNVTVMSMKKFCAYTPEEGWTVTGVSANHDPETAPQHLLFEKNGKKLLYACDGAWFMTATYNFLKKSHLELLIIDATCGDGEGDYRIAEHNTIPMLRLMLPSLKTVEMVDEHTEIYLTHLAPSLHKSHAETVEIVRPMGCRVAFDGLRLTI